MLSIFCYKLSTKPEEMNLEWKRPIYMFLILNFKLEGKEWWAYERKIYKCKELFSSIIFILWIADWSRQKEKFEVTDTKVKIKSLSFVSKSKLHGIKITRIKKNQIQNKIEWQNFACYFPSKNSMKTAPTSSSILVFNSATIVHFPFKEKIAHC